ncbi:MAG: cache domain-containing protein, partial [Treponema lecithinolyticum]|uniref:cache domain-containing protein n=1 Tax=Treponema lecithinolyticum TaxID=53418 RepID=UPI003FA334F2
MEKKNGGSLVSAAATDMAGTEKTKKEKKRFSLRRKLLLIFGLLIVIALTTEGVLAIQTARKAVMEKITVHLTDKATDTAEILDGKVTALFQFLEGIARVPRLRSDDYTYVEKTQYLQKEAARNPNILEMGIVDANGIRHLGNGRKVSVGDTPWFKTAVSGTNYISEPTLSRADNKLIIIAAVPIFDDNRAVVGVIAASLTGTRLCDLVDDIVVGKTGYCFVLGLTGTHIAHKDTSFVERRFNTLELAKTDPTLTSTAVFVQHALEVDESEIGYYEYKGVNNIASYATMKTTGWTVIIKAPVEEFMNTVNELRREMILIALILLAAVLAIVFFIARKIVKPIQSAVDALKDIAQGEGDLTVRLPIMGNDEVTDLSEYFNQTISKIGSSIKSVEQN